MDEKTTKIIKERFDALPESIKQVILSSNYEESLLEIGKKYNLKVEQLGALEVETTLVMMGLTPTKDFESTLTRELHVDASKGNEIVKDINEKIFFKIRELLKLMNTPAGEEPVVEEAVEEIEPRYEDKELKNTGADWNVMKSAGIEIVEKNGKLPVAEKLEINSPAEVHPILTQKLSGISQIPPVKTEHTLENITKTTPPTSTPPASYPPKQDPYRMKPE